MGLDEKIKQLEECVSKLEDNSVTIEEAMSLFEKGSQISKDCLEQLTQAKGKIYIIKKDVEQFREELTTKEMK